MSAMHGTVKPLVAPQTGRVPFTFLGQEIHHQAGQAIISITWIRGGAYRIEIRHRAPLGAGRLIDAVSYPDEDGARAEARRVARVYKAFRTVAEVHRSCPVSSILRPPCHRHPTDQTDPALTDLLAASLAAAAAVQALPADQRLTAWQRLRDQNPAA
jgi:hypothetical protein